jgi:siroheme decarboxylase
MSQIELDNIDKKILVALQGDLDDSPEPYAAIATSLNVAEKDVISRVARMLEAGVIRRLGAMIRHIEAGIGFNGMVVWKVEPERIEEVGYTLAAFPEVTHCYERPPFDENAGTLFTMAHAASEEECLKIIEDMSQKTGISEYEILFSEQELKKVSMTYFDENDS